MTDIDTPTTAPFSQQLRTATASGHRQAESSAFLGALFAGRLDRVGYAQMVAQHHFAYRVLESAAEVMSDDPVAGPFVHDELTRGPALASDLEFLLGPSWADRIVASDATTRYCRRMADVCTRSATAFVAHHYTRYLGDLSGGQMIKRAIQRTPALGGSGGIAFYEFTAIADPAGFRDHYRGLLDAAAWDDGDRAELIDEVVVAYRHNTEVLADLDRLVEQATPVDAR